MQSPSARESACHDDGIPVLPERAMRVLLARLGAAPGPIDASWLQRVQWRWLQAHPFHNVELLAGYRDGSAPISAEAIVDRTLAGTGGPCHVQAVGFAALLRAQGLEVALAAGTIGEPGDHLLTCVRLPSGERFVCDVGNGHPYRRPFPLDDRLEQDFHGWRFLSEPHGRGLRLTRYFPDGTSKHIYDVDLEPCALARFADQIAAHHGQPGFGPFLTGLRAVRIHDEVIATYRDRTYQRTSAAGTTTRLVRSREACLRALRSVFGLDGLPLEAALDTLGELGGEPWPHDEPIELHERACVLVSCSVTDRPAALRRLVSSLRDEAERSRRAQVELLVVENGLESASRDANRGLLAEAGEGVRVHLVDDGSSGRSIAASRRAQTLAIARCVRSGTLPACVWMLDEDLALEQLWIDDDASLRRGVAHGWLDRWLELRDEHPEISVAIGRVTGDPPIRPDAMLRTQLLDLRVVLERFAALPPAAQCPRADDLSLFELEDYYYDLSDTSSAHLDVAAPWLVRREAGPTVRDQVLVLLREACALASGRAVTRPLVLLRDWRHQEPAHGTRRGGNTVFFDIDACLAHTYPECAGEDFVTRRADMVGATRLQRDGVWQVREVPMWLLHERAVGDRTAGFDQGVPSWPRVRDSLLGEFFGVLLARLAMGLPATEPEALTRLAHQRARRIADNLAVASDRLDALRRLCRAAPGWFHADLEVRESLEALAGALTSIEESLLGGATAEARAMRRHEIVELLTAEHRIAAVLERHRTLDASDAVQRAEVRSALMEVS